MAPHVTNIIGSPKNKPSGKTKPRRCNAGVGGAVPGAGSLVGDNRLQRSHSFAYVVWYENSGNQKTCLTE